MLLSCGVFVCLSGIMFDSPFLNDGNTPLRGMVLAYTSIIVIVFSILYFIAAFLYEIKISRLRKKTKRAVMWSKVKGFKGKLINQQRQIKSSQPPWKTKKQKFSLEGLVKVSPATQSIGETKDDMRSKEYKKLLNAMEAEGSDDPSTSSGFTASSSNASSTSSGGSSSLSNSTSSHMISSSESAGNTDNVSEETVEDGQSSSDVEYASDDGAMEGAIEASFALSPSNQPENGAPNANSSDDITRPNTDELTVSEKSDESDAREMSFESSDDLVATNSSSDSTNSSSSSTSSNTSEADHSRRSDTGEVVKEEKVEFSDDSSHAHVSSDDDKNKGMVETASLPRGGNNSDGSHDELHGVQKLEKPVLSSNTSSSDESSSDDSSSNSD